MSTTIAVVSVNGLLGKPVIEGLLSKPFISKIKTPIRLITSNPDKKVVDSDKVEFVNIKETSYTEALKGMDVVINLGNVPNSPLQEVLDAVIANKVKLYIPSQFGVDIEAVQKDFPGFLDVKVQHSKAARAAGIKTVDIASSFFFDGETFLGFDIPFAKIDKENKSVEIVGDAGTRLTVSWYRDIGLAVASVATVSDYEQLPDKIRIFSSVITIGDLLTAYEKKHGVTLTKTFVNGEKFRNELKGNYAKEGMNWDKFFLYLVAIFNGGDGKGANFESSNDRELVNPGESLFKWSKLA